MNIERQHPNFICLLLIIYAALSHESICVQKLQTYTHHLDKGKETRYQVNKNIHILKTEWEQAASMSACIYICARVCNILTQAL